MKYAIGCTIMTLISFKADPSPYKPPPLLWMNVIRDFICIGFVKLSATGIQRKIQNDNMCLHAESNLRLLAFQCVTLTTRL